MSRSTWRSGSKTAIEEYTQKKTASEIQTTELWLVVFLTWRPTAVHNRPGGVRWWWPSYLNSSWRIWCSGSGTGVWHWDNHDHEAPIKAMCSLSLNYFQTQRCIFKTNDFLLAFFLFWHVFPLCCFHVPVIYFKVISLNLIRRDIFTILLLLLPFLNYYLLLSLSPFGSIFFLHFLIDSTITSSLLCSFLTKERRLFLLLVLILMTGSGAATSDFWTTGTQPFIYFTGGCHQLSVIDQPVK